MTGASRGIGKAVAVALADAGADVAVSARTGEALNDTVKAVRAAGGSAVPCVADLSHEGAGAGLVAEAVEGLGGLDVLVHNAGVIAVDEQGTSRVVPLEHSGSGDWRPVVDVNVHGTVEVLRAAHPFLVKSQRASAVVMSSVAGVMGTPGMESYAATKAAQISVVRSLAVAWASDGVRVNALCPGWVATDMTGPMQAAGVSDWLLSHVPQGRWLSCEEVAPLAVFLASGASSAVTGHALVADGGVSIAEGGLSGRPKPASPFAA
ncbi:SDR family NAD(P)-dependent oxidoreductase [Streptomyces sp. TR06-5]|uniref:SDR family NAD(P)-dependent oxidoreductase n=1 Tax=Streptomyces sp. TR06-5 TaxID=3385976 RepID=UPI0039A15906